MRSGWTRGCARGGWFGADGAHRVIRKAAGIAFPGAPLIERFLLADVHVSIDRPRDATVAWLRGSGLLVAFPLPGADRWRLMAAAPPDGPAEPTAEQIVAALCARLSVETPVTVHGVAWTSTFRIQRRLAAGYRRGRVLLAGDAAHIHSPFGGQGMNTGLGDAENLAFKLALVAAGRADAALLDTYGAERRPVAKRVVSSTSGVTLGALGSGRIARLLRDRIAVPLLDRDWVQRRVTDQASGLRVSYRRGPLGAHRRPPWGLQPGDRVPDRVCRTPEGTAIRLYAALGPRWVLLGPPALARLAGSRLGAVCALHADTTPMLVRPDGHLAWRGTDPGALITWLDNTLGPR